MADSTNTKPVHIKNGRNYSGYNFPLSTDTKDCIVTYTSQDDAATTEKTSDGITSVATLASGEKHDSLFAKISGMFKNIRKLWNTVGTTDFSDRGQTLSSAVKAVPMFINPDGTLLHRIDTIGGSWTATQDCWAFIIVGCKSAGESPSVYLKNNSSASNSITVAEVQGVGDNTTTIEIKTIVPVKKGQYMVTRSDGVSSSVKYAILFYAM